MSEKSQKSSPKSTSARTSSAKISSKQSSTYEVIRNSSHNSIGESQKTTSIVVNNSKQASNVEAAILAATKPFEIAEKEIININGISGLWTNKSEAENWNGPLPLKEYPINNDSEPEVIKKRTDQTIIYEHEVAIRYLRPPTPPPPGELIIKQEKAVRPPPAPPVVIRQQPRKPETPPPLVVREEPPKPPKPIPPKVITVPGKQLPPPPRKVVIERFGTLPDKPRPIVIERWLPYGEQKRKIVYMKPNESESPVEIQQKNLVIEWEAPQVLIKKEFRDLGIVKVNPLEYYEKYNGELKPSSELPALAQTIQPPAGYTYAAEAPEPPVKLEGDIEALKLIDLEANGLSEYRYLLETNAISRSPNNGNTPLADVFATIDINHDGKISITDAEGLLVMLNNSLGRKYSNEDVKTFFSALDSNNDGYVDYEDFKNAFSSVLTDA
jgi:hypothetical protein